MKIIFDKEKYETQKKEMPKMHKVSESVVYVCGLLMVGFIILMFAMLLSLGFVDIPFETFQICFVTVLGLAFANAVLMFIARINTNSVPANYVYGKLLEDGYKITKHKVLYIGTAKDPCLRISYETAKGKEKMVLIPLEEKGFYYNIFEDVFDFAHSEGNSLNWYRPLSVELDRLKEESEERELPEHIKSLYGD